MPNHDEELKRFFNTPPPEADAEFEHAFEIFAQEIELKEVIRERNRGQERYIELLEKHNQLREVKSPVPDGLPFLAFMCKAAKELQLPGAILKKDLEDWLRDNWPDNLGKTSDKKIVVMATYLRGVDAHQPDALTPEIPETRKEKRARETQEKYARWYSRSHDVRREGKWKRPTDIARAVAKREENANADNVKRRLDEFFPGWATEELVQKASEK